MTAFVPGTRTTYAPYGVENPFTIEILSRTDTTVCVRESFDDIFGETVTREYTAAIETTDAGVECFCSHILSRTYPCEVFTSFFADDFCEADDRADSRVYSPSAPWLAPGMTVFDFT